LNKALVSIVVPTFNSERFLERCLASVKGQSYQCVEVVVVDNYSADRTREIAEGWGARVVLCRAGRSRARNVGAGLGKGKFVLFVDSDMELESSVIDECIKKVGGGYGGVIIPEFSVGESFWAKCKCLEKLCYIGDDSIEAARFFNKNIFRTIGGYDPRLDAGEDWDLNHRIIEAGYKIGRINAFITHHEGRLSLQETMLKKHYYGRTIKYYRTKHPQEAKQQLTLIRHAFIKYWKELAKDPIHAFGMFFMKACEFLSGWLGSQNQ
jgi:glycosyltransferase involved in cell wall biosynthesis